jgi:pimeloyl-ACP methyl ester carboxylesterase
MTENHSCDHANTPCPANAQAAFREALSRYRREAEHGVCRTGRYRLPYTRWGQGPPIVFIHGLADSRRSFIPVQSLLAPHFQCITYDLPRGRGDGARLWEYRHADLVADLFALLDHLELERSYVYGSSFGSTVALRAAHASPSRLPRVLLQGGFAYRPLFRPELVVARLACYLPGKLERLPVREKLLRHSHYEPFAGRPPEVWEAFLEHTGESPIAGTGYHALMLHRVDLRPILPQIRQPVLLICGDCDPLIGPRHEEVLLKGLPSAGRVTIAGCGHMPSSTHPEALAALIADFLTPPG